MRAAVAAAAVLALPAAAYAQQTPVPQPVAPKPTPKKPAAKPVAGRMRLAVERVYGLGTRRVALAGNAWRVHGTVAPYVPGQTVVVRFARGRQTVKRVRVAISPIRGGRAGTFVARLRSGRTGRVGVSARHAPTPRQVAMYARARVVEVIQPLAGGGARGLRVAFLQQRLARLGYAVAVTGYYDDRTQRAVLAYRKVNGMSRTTFADRPIFARAGRLVGGFAPRFRGQGRHVEADLSRQVIALIDDRDRVYRVYHMSSGKPSTPTILGTFRFYSKTPGVNSHQMLDSNYFVGGYAIHGYPDVPAYPASHGCVRVPNADAPFIFGWVRLGDRIDVYP